MDFSLIQCGVPLCFLILLIYWYSNLTSVVKWIDVFSFSFSVDSGVCQGGVLSPHLIAIWVNELIKKLQDLIVGCHIMDLFLLSIVYADNMSLEPPANLPYNYYWIPVVLYFGLINSLAVVKIFSCKNVFLSLICKKWQKIQH